MAGNAAVMDCDSDEAQKFAKDIVTFTEDEYLGDDPDLWYYQNGYMYRYDDGGDRKTSFEDKLRNRGKKKGSSTSSFFDYERKDSDDDVFSNIYGLPL